MSDQYCYASGDDEYNGLAEEWFKKYHELKKDRDTNWVKLAPYGVKGGKGRTSRKSAGMIEKIKQLQKENEKVEFYKDCFKQAEQERDYEHIRFLEEQSKRGDLEYEIEKLKEEEYCEQHGVQLETGYTIKELIPKFQEQKKMIYELKKENEKLKKENEELKQDLREERDNGYFLNDCLKAHGDRIEKLKKENKQLKEQIETLGGLTNKKIDEVVSSTPALMKLYGDIASLITTIKAKDEEIEKLKKENEEEE